MGKYKIYPLLGDCVDFCLVFSLIVMVMVVLHDVHSLYERNRAKLGVMSSQVSPERRAKEGFW